MGRDNGVDLLRCKANRFIPGCGNQPAAFLVPNQRRANSLLMIDEGMAEATFDTKELAVKAIYIAIARHDSHQLVAARAERHLATIRTIGARGNRLR